jgi:hypothetical protein
MQMDLGVRDEVLNDGMRDGSTSPMEMAQARHPRDEMAQQLPDGELRLFKSPLISKPRAPQGFGEGTRDVDMQRTDGAQDVVLANRAQTCRRLVFFYRVDGQLTVLEVAGLVVEGRARQGQAAEAFPVNIVYMMDDSGDDVLVQVGQRWAVGVLWLDGPRRDGAWSTRQALHGYRPRTMVALFGGCESTDQEPARASTTAFRACSWTSNDQPPRYTEQRRRILYCKVLKYKICNNTRCGNDRFWAKF